MAARLGQLNELMQRYSRGEDGVFEELYRLMAARLYRFCLRLTPARSEADDLLQETLLRVHRARATYLPGSNALHWALAISRAAHVDRLRYWRRRPEDLGSANDAAEHDRLPAIDRRSPESDARARDLVRVITGELAEMSETNRAAYVLLKEEGLSVREAAAALGTTEPVVRQRAHRAYEQLHQRGERRVGGKGEVMGKLEGKITLITGGSSGIGLATATRFVNEGTYTFITGRRAPELVAASRNRKKCHQRPGRRGRPS
jgi:RNA polymerase sigma-70 factor (ECF subfamily)